MAEGKGPDMAEGKRKVAIAVDNSEHAVRAFEFYVDNVRTDNDYLVVIHAPEVLDLSITSPAVASEVLCQLAAEVSALEAKFVGKMQGIKLGGKFRTGCGKPGEAICKLAEEEKVELLVTGTRGQGKFRRTIMGSVSDYLVHHSKCPVLVCRGDGRK